MVRRLAPIALLGLAALATGCGGDDGGTEHVTCAAGTVPCGSACVDLRSDEAACGACGNACPAGDACVDGGCRRACATQRFQTEGAIAIGVGENPVAVTAADADGDGLAELAVADAFRGLYVVPQTARGAFGEPVLLPEGNGPTAIVPADLDEDGRADLIVGELHEDRVLSMRNTGEGSFAKKWVARIGGYAHGVAAGDLDGDGHLDIVAALPIEAEVVLLRGTGTGEFSVLERAQYTNAPFAPAVGDFDGDGRADVAFGLEGAAVVRVLYRRDEGYVGEQIDVLGRYSGLAVGDFDGDGLDDLAVSGGGGTAVLLGRPTGPFERLAPAEAGLFSATLVAGDVDGDGRAEVLALGNDRLQTLAVEGTTLAVTGDEPLPTLLAPALVDVDGDRALDLVGATGLASRQVLVIPAECR